MTDRSAQVHEPADVYSDEGYYAVVPEWVLDADISAQAVRLYAVLRRYADQRTMFAHPSRRTLAGRIKVRDEKVVDRALADLQGIGAVEVIPRWRDEAGGIAYAPDAAHRERTSNGYRLRRAMAVTGGGGGGFSTPTPRPVGPHPGGAKAPGVGAQKGEEPQPGNYSQGDHTTGPGEVSHLSSGPAAVPSQAGPPPQPAPSLAAPRDGLGQEPPSHCRDWPHPPRACPPCGDARQANAAWWADELPRRRDRDADHRRQHQRERSLAAAELAACWLCDEEGTAVVEVDGERVQSLCLHDAHRNVAAVVNRRAARAALVRRGGSA